MRVDTLLHNVNKHVMWKQIHMEMLYIIYRYPSEVLSVILVREDFIARVASSTHLSLRTLASDDVTHPRFHFSYLHRPDHSAYCNWALAATPPCI